MVNDMTIKQISANNSKPNVDIPAIKKNMVNVPTTPRMANASDVPLIA